MVVTILIECSRRSGKAGGHKGAGRFMSTVLEAVFTASDRTAPVL